MQKHRTFLVGGRRIDQNHFANRRLEDRRIRRQDARLSATRDFHALLAFQPAGRGSDVPNAAIIHRSAQQCQRRGT